MGVPSFYRWLTNKYPNIVVNAVEERESECIDWKLPNPNGLEFDNLYLDMNGIIHPCFHPDDNIFPPATYEEVFDNVFEYIDRLFNIVRPRRLLYMAIDGVAPRAKMNQQRARRFRTAKDIELAEKEEEKLRRQFQMEGKEVLPKQESETSDSNVITPGTEFLYRMSKKLQRYICLRKNNNPRWNNIKVILSDANVPGEGEHKIMSFIRLQRTDADYNPNTRHCLYGLDADLIMLALATHEVHFSILREEVLVQDQKQSCGSALELSLHKAETSSQKERGWFNQCVLMQGQKPQEVRSKPEKEISHDEAESSTDRKTPLSKKPYQFLNVWIMREYLELDMKIINPPEKFKADFERIVDDFIFLCFFVGNDFLPHMPTLEIHEGAIDLLIHVYTEEFKNLGGYLVDMQRVEDPKAGYVKLKRVEKFILLVGTYEEKIFKKRADIRERKLRKILSDYADAQDDESLGPTFNPKTIDIAIRNGEAPIIVDSATASDENHTFFDTSSANNPEILKNTKELKEKLKDHIRKISDVFKNGGLGTDKVRLGEEGWRERYYKQKFSAESREDIESTRKAIIVKYTEGLCWVLLYYFSGVPSWTWFYPFHYGPFASDFKGIAHTRVKFQKGLPFKPFDQLMGVLPPRSAHALPLAYQPLMTNEHSDIIDFYPADFEVDVEGKRYEWQGICKLSFIEENRLLAETRKLEKDLRENEARRNGEHVDLLFVGSSCDLGKKIISVYKDQASMKQNDVIKIDPSLSGGISGFLRFKLDDSKATESGSPEDDIQDCNVLCLFYEPPPFSPHIPRPLAGVEEPIKTISEDDIVETQLWHEYRGSNPSNMRMKTQAGQWKTNSSYKSSAINSSSEIFIGAGSGWSGGGRGKACPSPPNYERHSEYTRTPTRNSYKSSSMNSSSEIFIGTCSGLSGGGGRGKACPLPPDYERHSNYTRPPPLVHGERVALPYSSSAKEPRGPSSSNWVPRPSGSNFNSVTVRGPSPSNLVPRPSGRNCNPVTVQGPSSSNWVPRPSGRNFNLVTNRGMYNNSNERWRAVGLGQAGEPRGFEDLSISGSSRGFNPYGRGRAQSGLNNFWSPRSSSDYSATSRHEFRQSVRPYATSSGRGWDRQPTGSTENTGRAWQRTSNQS